MVSYSAGGAVVTFPPTALESRRSSGILAPVSAKTTTARMPDDKG